MDLTNTQRDAWDKLGQRYEEVGFGRLSTLERQFVALEALAGDTLNGSLDQYFCNSSGDLALIAIEAIDALGEQGVSATLREVISELWPTGYPTDRSERNERFSNINDDVFLESESDVIVASHERLLAQSLDALAESYAKGSI